MKRLIIAICCTLSVPTAAIAGVANIKHMSRNSNGTFDVICTNQTLETVNSKSILDNSVCNNVSDKPPTKKHPTKKPRSVRESFICNRQDGHSFSYGIIKISDGKQIGKGGMSGEECLKALKTLDSNTLDIVSEERTKP